jgi:hypothetical protein
MKPNILDNEFKTKLNAREIEPSQMAWDRLDAMLTVAEKPKRSYNWMYIAASFLGFILIATVFLSQTKTVTDKAKTNMVFENKNLQVDKKTNEIEKEVVSNTGAIVKNVGDSASKKSSGIGNILLSKKISKQKSNVAQNTTQQQLNNQINQSNKQNQVVKNTIINQENEQNPILKNIESSNSIVAENAKNAKVDELLANATAFKTVNPKIKINPNDLLSQVDGELELTFREKVIQTVNRNFKSVKVAIANRNK